MKASVYTRPAKPLRMAVTRRERVAERLPDLPQPIAVDSVTECHVTPMPVARRMVGYLGAVGPVLEPSAGTGNLVQALTEADYSNITAIERHWSLVEAIEARFPGLDPVQGDFLEYDPGKRFPCIVMNPPFRQVNRHIELARHLLTNDGVLIALVPITFNRTGTELEVLGPDTFPNAKVHTKIVRITHG